MLRRENFRQTVLQPRMLSYVSLSEEKLRKLCRNKGMRIKGKTRLQLLDDLKSKPTATKYTERTRQSKSSISRQQKNKRKKTDTPKRKHLRHSTETNEDLAIFRKRAKERRENTSKQANTSATNHLNTSNSGDNYSDAQIYFETLCGGHISRCRPKNGKNISSRNGRISWC